jgi:hypothetical protein
MVATGGRFAHPHAAHTISRLLAEGSALAFCFDERQQFWRRTGSRNMSEGNMSGCGPGRSAALAESTGSDFGHYDITDMSGEQPEQSNDRRYPSKCARYARHLSPVTESEPNLRVRLFFHPISSDQADAVRTPRHAPPFYY